MTGMPTSNSTNIANSTSTCAYDAVYARVTDPAYNWTSAWDQYRDGWSGRTSALTALFKTRVGDQWVGLPGCFYLGVLDETKVEECEKGGGMAVVTTRTKDIVDVDVWYCALPSNSPILPAPSRLTDDNFYQMRYNVSQDPITCIMPSQNAAAPRAALSHWAPLIAVGLASMVALF